MGLEISLNSNSFSIVQRGETENLAVERITINLMSQDPTDHQKEWGLKTCFAVKGQLQIIQSIFLMSLLMISIYCYRIFLSRTTISQLPNFYSKQPLHNCEEWTKIFSYSLTLSYLLCTYWKCFSRLMYYIFYVIVF